MKNLDFRLSEGSSVVLDLIRGVSAQLVVVGHGFAYFGVARFLHEPSFPWMQNIAVLIFFLLSGFLIPYSVNRRLIQDSEYSFSYFFVDRFARIYVPFLSALVFVFAVDGLSRAIDSSAYKFPGAFNLKTFLGNVLMLQDFPFWELPFSDRSAQLQVTSFGSARPFWTLAVEWWIYLFFGFVTLVLVRRRRLDPVAITIACLLSIVPVFNLVMGRGDGLTAYWLIGTLVFMLVALKAASDIPRSVQFWMMVFSFGLGLLRAYVERNAYDTVFAFLLGMSMWLVIELCRDVDFGSRGIQLIKLNASFSFTLYLVHYSVLDFIRVHFDRLSSDLPWIMFGVAFVLSNLIALVIGFFSEGVMTRWVKTRLYGLLARRSENRGLSAY